MRRLLPLLLAGLVAGLVAGLLPGTGTASAPAPVRATGTESRAEPSHVRLDGVSVRLRNRTRQVVTVNHTGGYRARVIFWTLRDGTWHERFRATDGRIGYSGLVRPDQRVQGSGKTPLGTHRLPWAFGTHPREKRWDPSYRRIRSGDYWVLDNESAYYNRYRNRSQGGFRWGLPASDPNGSERLQDYPRQYEYSITTSFNQRQVRHRGGAIFLHVNGSGATAGCVSAPRWFLRRLMVHLDADRVPVIAIGR